MARVAAGVARVGVDTGPSTLVQEAALEDRAVSFTKGCYLGQETVARLQFRGRANRAPARRCCWTGPAEPPAAAVTAGGREVGPRDQRGARPPTWGRSGWRSSGARSRRAPRWRSGGAAGRVAGLPFARR